MEEKHKQPMNRRRFLQVGGSAIAGGSIVGLAGVLFNKRLVVRDTPTTIGQTADEFASPYRRVSSWDVAGDITAFEMAGDIPVVGTANSLYIYRATSKSALNVEADERRIPLATVGLRDIAYSDGTLYLLFPSRIEAYDMDGRKLREWLACDEQSDYCSLAAASGAVFATDAANKNIHKYSIEGNFVKFINSPNRFIIPSYTFGITCCDGVLYCSNSGRHHIEKYTLDGDYLGSFGEAGATVGSFCGCCNPVHLTHTANGELITSEKGIPRISCYDGDGKFRSLLLDTRALGGGATAYHVKVNGDRLFAAGGKTVSVYRYDPALAAQTACADCVVNCPLRRGISV
jgi:hypothetical protein